MVKKKGAARRHDLDLFFDRYAAVLYAAVDWIGKLARMAEKSGEKSVRLHASGGRVHRAAAPGHVHQNVYAGRTEGAQGVAFFFRSSATPATLGRGKRSA